MSKTQNFCFSLCLEVDKRDDDPKDPGDPCRRWTEALNPSSFHCWLSQDSSLSLDLSWSLCARLCALGWSVVCHRNLFLRKRAVIRHTTLSFSDFLVSYCLLGSWEAFQRCLQKQIRSNKWRRKKSSSPGTAERSLSISSTSICSDICEWDMVK